MMVLLTTNLKVGASVAVEVAVKRDWRILLMIVSFHAAVEACVYVVELDRVVSQASLAICVRRDSGRGGDMSIRSYPV